MASMQAPAIFEKKASIKTRRLETYQTETRKLKKDVTNTASIKDQMFECQGLIEDHDALQLKIGAVVQEMNSVFNDWQRCIDALADDEAKAAAKAKMTTEQEKGVTVIIDAEGSFTELNARMQALQNRLKFLRDSQKNPEQTTDRSADQRTRRETIFNANVGPEPETTPAPRPETTTAPPTADHDITIAFFAAKPSGGAEFRRKRDGANSSLPDDAILMNALVDAWSDSLSEGKLTITFIPYADIPASPVTMTTVKDAKDFISNTYAELPALPAGKDPSQLAVVKAYQSRPTAQAKKLTKVDLVLINVSLTGNTYFSPQTRVDDMAATGKVLKDISTQPNQLATVVAGSNTTAEDMQFYGDVGPSVSIVPEARMHLQELANMFTCTMCTLGDITLTPGTVTPTGTGPTIGVDKCADLTVTCANPGGTVFMQFNVGEGGPAIGETVTAVLDCVNGKWEYAPADQPSRPITEVNCVST